MTGHDIKGDIQIYITYITKLRNIHRMVHIRHAQLHDIHGST